MKPIAKKETLPATDPATDPDVRKTGLGGSDMGSVLGLNPWKSAWRLYHEKIGALDQFEGNDATRFGIKLEDDIAEMYSEDTGKKLQRKLKTQRHPTHDWAFCHIDRKVVGESAAVEIKTTTRSDDWGATDTDEIPSYYLAQCHHQIWINDFERCYVAVGFLHTRKIGTYIVERSPTWDTILAEQGEAFWHRVQNKRPPAIDYQHPEVVAALGKIYDVEEFAVELSPAALRNHEMREDLLSKARAYDKAADALKAEILDEMRNAMFGKLPDGSAYRRKKITREGYTVPTKTYTDFRHIKSLPKSFTG